VGGDQFAARERDRRDGLLLGRMIEPYLDAALYGRMFEIFLHGLMSVSATLAYDANATPT
jgi:hypothetical protein